MAFYESPRFPLDLTPGTRGGPEFSTDIVTVRSGYEYRNINWQFARRKFNASGGVKSIGDVEELIHFFRIMRGRAHGFRVKDWSDYKSCGVLGTPANTDQIIGTGDGSNRVFQLTKRYTDGVQTDTVNITKPVSGTVIVAVNGVASTDWTVNTTTGIVTFNVGFPPPNTHVVTAGYQYDVPCRFDTDFLDVELLLHSIGSADVPLVEIRV